MKNLEVLHKYYNNRITLRHIELSYSVTKDQINILLYTLTTNVVPLRTCYSSTYPDVFFVIKVCLGFVPIDSIWIIKFSTENYFPFSLHPSKE